MTIDREKATEEQLGNSPYYPPLWMPLIPHLWYPEHKYGKNIII